MSQARARRRTGRGVANPRACRIAMLCIISSVSSWATKQQFERWKLRNADNSAIRNAASANWSVRRKNKQNSQQLNKRGWKLRLLRDSLKCWCLSTKSKVKRGTGHRLRLRCLHLVRNGMGVTNRRRNNAQRSCPLIRGKLHKFWLSKHDCRTSRSFSRQLRLILNR